MRHLSRLGASGLTMIVRLCVDTESLSPCQRPGDVGRDKDHRIDLEEVNFAFSEMLT